MDNDEITVFVFFIQFFSGVPGACFMTENMENAAALYSGNTGYVCTVVHLIDRYGINRIGRDIDLLCKEVCQWY